MILLLLLVPLCAGVAAFWLPSQLGRRALLLGTAVAHTCLTIAAWMDPPAEVLGGWLQLDDPGLLFLGITTVLFLASSVYALGYLHREALHRKHGDYLEGFLYANEPEAVFIGCLLLFLASMTMVTVSHRFGLLWVGVEATTLASAPLIYFHKHHRSLEATWKYLLICSVGIALALLGNFTLAAAAAGGRSISLFVADLVAHGHELKETPLKAAFLFFLVGYGTKMGLAPLHTWLPDAHSEAPSLVSALLSGALLNCAFLGILRAHQVCLAAGIGGFSQQLLLGFGIASIAAAAVFILGQTDFKRMLAYSSVEHMGILALGVGLGGAGLFGAMYHAVNHSLTKAALFLISGNILALYQTKATSKVTGLLRVLPFSGVLWIAGFLAITGSPPFGPFLSEVTILRAAFEQGRVAVAIAYLVLLAIVFIGMATIVLRMTQGSPSPLPLERAEPEAWWATIPSAVLCGLVLVLGVYLPPALSTLLREAAHTLGGNG
jgi:hydrogenase-4 component F